VTFKVEFGKEIVREERSNYPAHLSMGVPEVFGEGKKGFDFHSFKMVFNPMFIPWLRVDDKPMKTTKKP